MKKRQIGKYIALAIAVAGIILGIVMVVRGGRTPPHAEAYVPPPIVPFDTYIAGAGLVEASSHDVSVATPLSGVVTEVYVEVGDGVKKGQPLFRLDEREEQAKLALRKSELEVAKKKVVEASSVLDDKLNLLNLVNQVTDKRAVAREEVDKRRHAVRLAQAELQTAKAQVQKTQKEIEVIETDLERMTVRAPFDAEVLQVNVRTGEYATAGENDDPLMLLGNTNPLYVRVDIDEYDAWRFDPEGTALAIPRGNPNLRIPLKFVYVEPYIIPKKSLTGGGDERVDTRVLQVFYSFNKQGRPVYVGQQVDVYIDTPKEMRP